MPRIKNLSSTTDRIAIKIAKKLGQYGKRESRVILRSLKSQIRKKRKPSLPGQTPHSRSGKFRKLIQSRKKFQGSGRIKDGAIPFLKIGSWTPIANVLLSPASGKKFRKLRHPSDSEINQIVQRAWSKTFNDRVIKNMLIKETKKAVFGKPFKIGAPGGPIIIEYKG